MDARKRRNAVAAVIAVLLLVLVLFAVLSCSSGVNDDGGESVHANANAVSGNTDSAGKAGAGSATVEPADGESQDAPVEGREAVSPDSESDAGQTASSDASPKSSQSATTDNGYVSHSGNDDTGSRSSGNSASTEPQRTWVVDYEQVWVEDSPAWTEQVPVYGMTEVSICNVCGADLTGSNISAHVKEHALAGEGGGHHTEWGQTVTGYETVEHAAVGHWETVESGGH